MPKHNTKGWYKEPRRHSLAAKGIKTVIPALQKKVEIEGRIKLDKDKKGGQFSLSNKNKKYGFNIKGKAQLTDDGVHFRYKQNHQATKIRDKNGKMIDAEDAQLIEQEFRREMNKLGIRFDSDWRNNYSSWKTSQFRHTKSVNRNTYSGRRSNVLSWDDWVDVNNAFNKVMDRYGISANINTLAGKFVIRKGNQAYTEDDWQDLAMENVGSMMNPIQRQDLYERIEEEKKEPKKKSESGREILRKEYGTSKNVMTPTKISVGKLNKNTAYELSSGRGFMNEPLYGVSIAQINDKGETRRRSDISKSFSSKEKAETYIGNLRGNLPKAPDYIKYRKRN